MDKLLGLIFGTPWWLVLALAVYGFCWATYRDLWQAEPSRARWIGYLTQNTWSNRYRALLRKLLDWIDARLTPEVEDEEKKWQPDEARTAWSYGLLNLSLLLAVAYPILSVLVHWGVTNADGRIGALVLIEGGQPDWRRLTAIGSFALVIGGAIMVRRIRGQSRRVQALVGFGFALGLAFAGALAAAVAAAGTFAVAAAFPGALLFGLAFAGALAVAVAFAGAFAFAGAQNWLGRRTGQPVLMLTLFVALLLAAIAIALRLGGRIDEDAATFILFLGILPILNALADFASTGLTRWRLRKGLEGRMWREMLIDLGGAVVLFFLLGAASILAIDWMRWSGGTPLFDLPAFFAHLRENPHAYWWLYFTLFSTLIPTVLHASVALFGSLIHLWPGLRRYIVENLAAGGRGDDVAGRWAVLALCLAMTVSVVAPVFVLGHLVVYRGIVGHALLDLFEGFAQLVGAIPSP